MNISIASGKGGTGKTTISIALAVLSSEKYKTALFDLDVEEPNSGIFFKKNNSITENVNKSVPRINVSKCLFCGICEDVCNFNAILKLREEFIINDNLCHSCNACYGLCPQKAVEMVSVRTGEIITSEINSNLSLIEAVMDVGIEQSTQLIQKTTEKAQKEYSDREFIFFDAPPGTSCPAVAAIKNRDFVLLVAEPTLFGFNDLKLAVNMLKQKNAKFAVTLNKYDSKYSLLENYCEEQNITIVERIPLDISIAKKYSCGENPILTDKEFRKKIENILNYIIGINI